MEKGNIFSMKKKKNEHSGDKGHRPAAVRTCDRTVDPNCSGLPSTPCSPRWERQDLPGLSMNAAQWLPPRCPLVTESEQKAGGALGDPTAFQLHPHHLLLLLLFSH